MSEFESFPLDPDAENAERTSEEIAQELGQELAEEAEAFTLGELELVMHGVEEYRRLHDEAMDSNMKPIGMTYWQWMKDVLPYRDKDTG